MGNVLISNIDLIITLTLPNPDNNNNNNICRPIFTYIIAYFRLFLLIFIVVIK